MKFVPIWSYDNYVPAHLAMGRLKEDGVECWLKDENTVTIDPLLSNAVGGIKLMVAESQAEQAWQLLKQLEQDYKDSLCCPNCHSSNIKLIAVPEKEISLIGAFTRFFLGNDAKDEDKKYQCLDCKQDFAEPVSSHDSREPEK